MKPGLSMTFVGIAVFIALILIAFAVKSQATCKGTATEESFYTSNQEELDNKEPEVRGRYCSFVGIAWFLAIGAIGFAAGIYFLGKN